MLSYLQILCCAVLWGFAGPMIRWSGLSSLSVVALRFALPTILSLVSIYCFEKGRLHKIDRPILFASFFNAIGNGFYISAFAFTSISNVLLLLYTRPVIATLMASILLKEQVSSRLWCLLFISFIGALLIITSNDITFSGSALLGMLLALAAAFTISLAWAYIKKYGYGERSASEVLFYQNLFGAIVALPLLPSVLLSEPIENLSIGLLYSLVVGFVATLMYFKGLQVLPLSRVMPITYAELVVAVTVGVIAFGDTLSMTKILGGLLIVISSLSTLLIKNKNRLKDAEKIEHA